MTEVKSDENRCDISKTPVEESVDKMADKESQETNDNSSTVDFAARSWKTDFTLIAEGKKFYVAKTVLALASPVFNRMFESDFKESTTDELELPGKRSDDVKDFLLAIYPNTPFTMSKESALKILPFAEEYQVLNLKRRCEEVLLGSINELTATEELFWIIREAHLYNLKELSEICAIFVSDLPLEDIEVAIRDIDLPAEMLRSILQNIISRVKSLESSKLNQAEQLQTFKTWKNFFSKALAKSAIPKLDEDLAWLGQTKTFMLDVKDRKGITYTVTIWNTELTIIFWFKSECGCTIYATLMNEDEHEVMCEFSIQFAVVNKMPAKEHLSVKHKAKFCSGRQSSSCYIASVLAIEDPKKGFTTEGKIQLEVNIFMSEPQKL